MRNNHRHSFIDAALRIIYRDGWVGVTHNAVAAEAGMTRPGILYHFPTRESLIHAIQARLVEQLSARMVAIAKREARGSTKSERAAAFAAACSDTRTFSELDFIANSGSSTQEAQQWRSELIKWSPQPLNRVTCAKTAAQLVAALAAEGLLVHELLHGQRLDPGSLSKAKDLIAEIADGTAFEERAV